MEFKTLDEALDHHVLCGTCGRPKKALQSIYSLDGVRYQVVNCKSPYCRVHCQSKKGCRT